MQPRPYSKPLRAANWIAFVNPDLTITAESLIELVAAAPADAVAVAPAMRTWPACISATWRGSARAGTSWRWPGCSDGEPRSGV